MPNRKSEIANRRSEAKALAKHPRSEVADPCGAPPKRSVGGPSVSQRRGAQGARVAPCATARGKFLAGLLVLLLASCSAGPTPAASGATALETFLADIAQNVAGDRLHVDSLLPPGVDPHEFQPAPQDAIRIAQSRILIVNGLGYETWLQKTLQDGGTAPLVITAAQDLAPASGGDPHLWMDPANVVRYVDNIRDGLTLADPSGKDVYAANASAYAARLTQLDDSILALVAQV